MIKGMFDILIRYLLQRIFRMQKNLLRFKDAFGRNRAHKITILHLHVCVCVCGEPNECILHITLYKWFFCKFTYRAMHMLNSKLSEKTQRKYARSANGVK